SKRHASGLRCRVRPAGSRSRPRQSRASPDNGEAPPARAAAPAEEAAGRHERRASTTARVATRCASGQRWNLRRARSPASPAGGGRREGALKMLAPGHKISMVRATLPAEGRQSTARLAARFITDRGIASVKVIASSLRKGNIVDLDGRLYVILTAENIHPGKGTPVTQVDMRRLSDGVKASQRYKTTDQVERAHVEEREYQFIDAEGYGQPLVHMDSYGQR